jgi:hypothetical protein
MHPEITQAIAAQQARELRADGAAARRTRHLRRSLPGDGAWRFAAFPRSGRAPALRPAARPLRSPRAA